MEQHGPHDSIEHMVCVKSEILDSRLENLDETPNESFQKGQKGPVFFGRGKGRAKSFSTSRAKPRMVRQRSSRRICASATT